MSNQETKKEFAPSIDPSTSTVQDMFGKVLEKRIQSGALEKAIEDKVDKLIDETSRDVFASYAEVGKALKEQLSKAIMPKLESIGDLPVYHDFVTNRLKLAAQNFYDERMADVMDKELKQIFSEVPEQITLSWIVEKLVDEVKEDNAEGEITLIIETRDYSWCESDEFLSVYLDREPDKSSRDCEYDLHLSKDKETGKYKILGLKIGNKKSGERLAFGKVYGLEKILFNIYAMNGSIELDSGVLAEDYETSWCDY